LGSEIAANTGRVVDAFDGNIGEYYAKFAGNATA
jgi:hypothetical protein